MKSKRRYDDDHESSHERWLVSYADFITLMFAFFAVLYATSEQNLEKAKEFQDSINKYLIKAGAFGESGSKINPGEKGDTPIEQPVQTFKQNRPEETKDLEALSVSLEQKISQADRKKFLSEVVADDLGIRLSLIGGEIYAEGSDKFRPEAIPFVNRLGEILAGSRRRLMIQSFVGKGQSGNFKNPWEFASARSVSLVRYFNQKHQIGSDQLAAVTFGDGQAKAASATANDRVEIILVHEDLEL